MKKLIFPTIFCALFGILTCIHRDFIKALDRYKQKSNEPAWYIWGINENI